MKKKFEIETNVIKDVRNYMKKKKDIEKKQSRNEEIYLEINQQKREIIYL